MSKRLPNTVENGSVKFDMVEDVEFWLTPLNKIFLIHNKTVIFPALRGTTIVSYDNPHFHPGEKVTARVRIVLNKQHQIRLGWLTAEEEKDAWTFN
jgi:hypothetical protein